MMLSTDFWNSILILRSVRESSTSSDRFAKTRMPASRLGSKIEDSVMSSLSNRALTLLICKVKLETLPAGLLRNTPNARIASASTPKHSSSETPEISLYFFARFCSSLQSNPGRGTLVTQKMLPIWLRCCMH